MSWTRPPGPTLFSAALPRNMTGNRVSTVCSCRGQLPPSTRNFVESYFWGAIITPWALLGEASRRRAQGCNSSDIEECLTPQSARLEVFLFIRPSPPPPATISEADYDYCSPRNSFCPKFAPIVKLCSQKPKQNPNWCNQSSSRALSTSTHMIYKEFKQHIKRRALWDILMAQYMARK